LVDPDGKGVFYLRARVTAAENSGADGQVGKGLLIIKVKEQENQIIAYSVIADDSGNLSLNNGISTEPLCNDTEGKTLCYSTQYKIIGLMIPNSNNDLSGFSWKVNNVALTCTSAVSSLCNDTDNNILFFPVLGNTGESVNVVATALSKKTGGTIEITRRFVVVDPQVQIVSADTTNVWPKFLGYYKDLSGNKYPDYSSQVFETNPGNTIVLEAQVYSAWDVGQDFSWSIDGETQADNAEKVKLEVEKISGDNYNVGLLLTAAHTTEKDKQANNLRKALLKNWSVSPESVSDEDISTDIQINVVDSPSQIVTKANQTGFFASLISNLPGQLMFLLKITLTVFVLMFSMSLLFAFVPDSMFERKEGTLN
jgi:hypothetical protein